MRGTDKWKERMETKLPQPLERDFLKVVAWKRICKKVHSSFCIQNILSIVMASSPAEAKFSCPKQI